LEMPKPKTGKPPMKRKPGGRGRGKGRYVARRKVCPFCVNKVKTIDYKDVALLRRFISDRGRMEPRRKTGVCAKHQRVLSVALKRARYIALLPYTAEHVRESGILPPREHFARDGGPRRFAPREPFGAVARPQEATPAKPAADETSPEEAVAEATAPEAVAEEPTQEEAVAEATSETAVDDSTQEEASSDESLPDEKAE
jgi:small subunit ribosomal protein S18